MFDYANMHEINLISVAKNMSIFYICKINICISFPNYAIEKFSEQKEVSTTHNIKDIN